MKIRPSVAAITSSTATSSSSIEWVIELRQVGDDHRLAGHEVALAVLQVPLRHRHRLADQRDRARCAALRRARPSCAPTRAPRRGSGTGRRSAAWACRPAWSSRTRAPRRSSRLRGSAARSARTGARASPRPSWKRADRDLARLLARASRASRARAARARAPRWRRPVRPAWPALPRCLVCVASCSSIWLGRLVDERAGPEHDLHGLRARELPARPVRRRPRPASAARGDVARQAALEPGEPLDVRAQHQLLQVALDEHRDRLFAEAPVEALGGPVLGARARHERARRRASGAARSASAARAEPERRSRPRSPAAAAAPRRRRAPRGCARSSQQKASSAQHGAPATESTPCPRGPADSPERNWRTNGFSEANSSSRGAGFDDPALPQHRDVLGDAARAHDVVRDHHVAAAVLGVDLLDQLAQQRRAHRVEARVGLVEQHDFRVEHERAREARRACASRRRARWASSRPRPPGRPRAGGG